VQKRRYIGAGHRLCDKIFLNKTPYGTDWRHIMIERRSALKINEIFSYAVAELTLSEEVKEQ
jgi:hypothetical protein